ncbi:hypothetical protein V6N13_109344 [Hibiscus sabdariffa]
MTDEGILTMPKGLWRKMSTSITSQEMRKFEQKTDCLLACKMCRESGRNVHIRRCGGSDSSKSVRNYSPRERTLRATLECCNTIECHVRASEFLPNDQKEMELRASIKELGGRYPLPMHQTIPMLMKHHDEIRGYEESVGNEL